MNESITVFINARKKHGEKFDQIKEHLKETGGVEQTDGEFVFDLPVKEFMAKVWPVLAELKVKAFRQVIHRQATGALVTRPARIAMVLDPSAGQEALVAGIRKAIKFPKKKVETAPAP